MMKLLLSATAMSSALMLVSPANAADVMADPGFDWSGFYLGGQIGYGFGTDRAHNRNLAVVVTDYSDSLNTDGITGGLHVGYNMQTNSIVYGLESDLEFSDVGTSTHAWTFGTVAKSSIDAQGSIRLRTGVAVDRALFYMTGGLALGSINSDYYDVGAAHDSASSLKVGYTLGGGAEYAFSDNWSARLEYRFTSFDHLKNVANTTDTGWKYYDQHDVNNISLGVTYHF